MNRKTSAIPIICALTFSLFLACLGRVSASYSQNRCLSYDGSDDYAGTATTTTYEAAKLTIEVWLKPKYTIKAGSNVQYGHTYGLISCYRDVPTHQGWAWEFDYSDGSLWFYFRSGGVDRVFKTTRTVWNSTAWYHIAVTYDNEPAFSNVKFYVNRTLETERDSKYVISYQPAPLTIGSTSIVSTSAFGGLIDEFRIWNVSRSQTQIQDSWNRTLDDIESNSTGLIGYWRFDEGSGMTAADRSLQSNDMLLQPPTHTPSWVVVSEAPIVPEFPSLMTTMMFMTAAFLAIIIYRKRNNA